MKKFLFCSLLATAVALSGSVFAAKDKPAGAAAEGEAKVKVQLCTGEITAVDAAASSLTVKNAKDESKTFKVAADCKIAAGENKDAKLADLKVGDKVIVRYEEAGGAMVAKKIGPAPVKKTK